MTDNVETPEGLVLLHLTNQEVAAVIRQLSTAWLSGDPTAQAALKKLQDSCPYVCAFCFTDGRVGTHTMRTCLTPHGAIVKRG